MTNPSKTKSLSFPEAISITQSLIAQIKANELSEVEIQQAVSSILSTKNGGRGFFVSYLTSDESWLDNPPPGIINGLKSSLKVTRELLVKNLAMSSAMVITHQNNNDIQNVEDSQRVCQRTTNLIQEVDSKSITEELIQLQATIDSEQGKYQDFLERWQYDSEQKIAIRAAIVNTLK